METRSLILSPDQYTQVSTYDLLCAAEQGFVGLDHRFLHAIVDDPEKAIPDLLRFGLEERQDRREDLSEDLVQIFRHLRTARAIPYLCEHFRRNHLDADIPLICAFQEIGEAAVTPLIELYKESEFVDDSDAGFLLANLGVRDPRILDLRVERLKFGPIDAAHCLSAYGDPAAIPMMREAVEQARDRWVVSALRFCVEQLEGEPAPSDEEPFDLWELYPEKALPRFDLLTEAESESFLDSADAENRFAALHILYDFTLPRRLWDRVLDLARKDPNPRVRGKCWVLLIDAWERTDIQKAMRACLADETKPIEERVGALLSLAGRDGENPEIQRRIVEFYERPEVRVEALQAMVNTSEPEFAKYFRKHLDDPDRAICEKAMLGVGMLELESEAPRLAAYFKDADRRGDALPAYALCAPFEPTRAGLRRLFKTIESLSGGLSAEEQEGVKEALNTRAWRYDLEPIFTDDGDLIIDRPVAAAAKVGRNDPCPCGSGKKYKKCCGG